jgi:cytochrome c-type biogenesis protein CcmH
MNFIFWGLMLLMLLVAISLVIYPLLRVRGLSSIAYRESNLSLHEEKLSELDTDLAENRIDQEHYRIARQELDRELLDNIPEESKSTAAEHYAMRMIRHPAMALSIAVFVPAFSMLLYMQIGMHAANQQASTAPQAQQVAQQQQMAQQQQQVPSVEEMTLKLEQFVQQNQAGVKEWSMLARAYKHLGRYDESAQAFTRAIELQPNAQLMLEKAEALALSNARVFNDEARDLVMRASALEPDNTNALWFAGVAEFQHANYRESIEHLSRLSSIAEEDADVNTSIRFYIDKARAELIARGEDVPEVAVLLQANAGSTAPAQPAATAGAALKVNVSVSDEAREKFNPGDVVFVYAKAAQGPKMPLAVQRLTLAALPTSVTLDDSMAMIDGMNLSAFPSVIVAARISRSGSAIAQSGDYIGEYPVNDVNSAKDVISINIDRVVP